MSIIFNIEIIAEADIESITVKGIRRQIESEDGKDYTEEKDFFSRTIQAILEEVVSAKNRTTQIDASTIENEQVQSSVEDDYELALRLQQEEESAGKRGLGLRRRQAATLKKYTDGTIHISKKAKQSESGDNEKPTKASKNHLNKPMMMSKELQDLLGNQFTEISRPEAVKQIWAYIKANNLQDPADKRIIVGDEKFLAVFKRDRINCFAMNKVLSKHLFRMDSVVSSRRDSNADTESEEDESEKRKKGMNRRLLMVPGVTEEMPLPVVQATILNYTKVAKLRDTEDPDLVRIVPGSPIYDLLGCPSDQDTINVAHLITRINDLYERGAHWRK